MRFVNKMAWGLFAGILLAVIFCSNFSVLSVGFMDEKRIVEAAFLLAGSVLWLIIYFRNKISLNDRTFYSGLAVFVLGCLSSIFAPLPQWAFLQVGWYILLGCSMLICAFLYQQNNQRYIKFFIGSLFILAGIYIAHVLASTIISYFYSNWPLWPNKARLSIIIQGQQMIPQGFLNFSNKRFFNHLQTWSLPLLVFGALYYKNKLIAGFRYLLYAITAGWWMLVFAAQARGTILASVVSLIFIGIFFKDGAWEYIKVYLSVAVIGLVFYALFFFLPGHELHRVINHISKHESRLVLWHECWRLIVKHPWLGLGPMHFSHVSIHTHPASPHNFILQSMVEWGIPAFLLFAALMIIAFMKFVWQNSHFNTNREQLIKIGLTASIIAGCAHSMVSGIFNTPFSQILLCLIVGWAIGYYFEHADRSLLRKRRHFHPMTWAVGLLLISNTVYVAQKVGRDIPHIKHRNEVYIQNERQKSNGGATKFKPRFWQQGKIGIKR